MYSTSKNLVYFVWAGSIASIIYSVNRDNQQRRKLINENYNK